MSFQTSCVVTISTVWGMLVSILHSDSPLEVGWWLSQLDCGCGFWRAIPQRKDSLHHILVKEPGVPEVLLTVTTSEVAWWLPCESVVFLLLLYFWKEVDLLRSSLKSRSLYWVQLLRLLHCLEFSYIKIQYFAHFILISVWIQRHLSYTLDYNPILLCIIFQFFRISFGIVSMNSSIACVCTRAHAYALLHMLTHSHTHHCG